MEEEAECLAERAARQKEMPGHPSGANEPKSGCVKALPTKWANSEPRSLPKALVFAVPVATAPPGDEALSVEAVSPTMHEQAGLFSQMGFGIGR